MMKKPEIQEPTKTMKAAPKWAQLGEALLAEEEEAEESRLEEEGEDAFHGQRLADDAAGAARELRPVGAELEFHGNAGDDAEEEVDGEDFRPEARGLVVAVVCRCAGRSSFITTISSARPMVSCGKR